MEDFRGDRRTINASILLVLALTAVALVFAQPVSADTVYFSDDFENGLGKWEVSGHDWALIVTDSRSANQSVTDSPDGNYPPNSNATMRLAHTIDLTGSTSPVVSFWYKDFHEVEWNCVWHGPWLFGSLDKWRIILGSVETV